MEPDWTKLTQAERDAYSKDSEQQPGESDVDHQLRAQRLRQKAEATIEARTAAPEQ